MMNNSIKSRSQIYSLLIVAFLIISLPSCRALKLARQIKALKAQAELYAKALKEKDVDTLLEHTYPGLIDKLGGTDEARSTMKEYVDKLNTGGLNLENVLTGEPADIVKAGDEWHSTIIQTISVKVPGGYLDTDLSFLAVSKDRGKSWFFMDAYRHNVKELVPEFNDSLTIPKVGKPRFRN